VWGVVEAQYAVPPPSNMMDPRSDPFDIWLTIFISISTSFSSSLPSASFLLRQRLRL
jgi:hypothetical protein